MNCTTSHFLEDEAEFAAKLRRGTRATATCISLVTTRDQKGRSHGLAVSSAVQLPTALPTMMVAVRQSTASCAVIQLSNLYCFNQISRMDLPVLQRFSRNEFSDMEFSSEPWRKGLYDLPYLETATMSFFCRVIDAHRYEDQTVFVGRIEGVRLAENIDRPECGPLMWRNGAPISFAAGEVA